MSRTRVGATRTLLAAAFALCFSAFPGQSAAEMDLPSASPWRPDGLFLQSGWGKRVRATVVGAKWDWQWEQEFAGVERAVTGRPPSADGTPRPASHPPDRRGSPRSASRRCCAAAGHDRRRMVCGARHRRQRRGADLSQTRQAVQHGFEFRRSCRPWAGASAAAVSTRSHCACSTLRTRGSDTRTRARTSSNCATAGATDACVGRHRRATPRR